MEHQAGSAGASGAPMRISPGMMLPEVLREHPQVRPVFDRYGLRGCGGAYGPAESIAYFARAHGIEEEKLLKELNAALDHPGPSTEAGATAGRSYMEELGDAIYRRFFKAGVVVVLTAGAVWGAILLLRISVSESFTSISIHEINAHGHAQIFGWVGLFVMGFAYQAFPRLKHTNLWRPDLANMSFYLMVFGVFARAIGEPLFSHPMFRELAVTASLAEIAAIGLFVAIILRTLVQSGKPLGVADGFVLASMLFFFGQAVAELGLVYTTTANVSRETLLHLVSTYQGPLRDLQIHGFAMLMILGVGLRMFPALFGFAEVRPRVARLGLVLLVVGVIGEAGFFVLMRQLHASWATGALYGSMVVVAATSVALTARWGLLARPTERDRSTKFIRAGVVWLHVSMLMLVLMPVYTYAILPSVGTLSESGSRAVAIGFSHAYGGAVRHAITVGFISLMILGMAGKVVPTLNGVDIRRLHSLWLPFALVNVGCAMRVGFQILTDFGAWAYPVAGVSGLLEVAGIAVWGVHLWRIMNGWNPVAEAIGRPSRITLDDKVGQVVEWFPQTLPVFVEQGFAPLANPFLRRTVARAISIRQAAAQHGMDPDRLLEALNAAAFDACCHSARDDRGAGVALPVLQ